MYQSTFPLCLLGLLAFTFCSCDQDDGRGGASNQIVQNHSRTETVIDGKIKLILDGKDGEGEIVLGSGKAGNETRQLDSFSHIETRMGVGVKIVRGETASVNIKTDDNILPVILTEIRDGKLVIDASQSLSSTMPIHLLVTAPKIESASTAGSGQIFLDDVAADSLKLVIHGSGGIGGQGKLNSIEASIHGSGKLPLEKFVATNVSVKIHGSGSAKVQALNTLDASISGSGTIKYVGKPQKVNRSITGSGSIEPTAK